MRMLAPDGCTGFTINGMDVPLDDDGVIDLVGGLIDVAKSHGFVQLAPSNEREPVELMTRAELVRYVMGVTKTTIDTLSTEELRARLVTLLSEGEVG